MQKIKTVSSSLAVLLMALAFTVSVPVYAQHGSDDSVAASSTSSSSSTETEHTGTTSGTNVPSGSGKSRLSSSVKTEDNGSVETENETANDDSGHHAELRQRGAELVADMQKEHKSSKTAEEKAKTCESHKQGLNTKFSRLDTNSQRIQGRIDSIFQKAQDYQAANNVSGVDALVTAAKTAQTNSAASISAAAAILCCCWLSS
jgi:hypothetical protein